VCATLSTLLLGKPSSVCHERANQPEWSAAAAAITLQMAVQVKTHFRITKQKGCWELKRDLQLLQCQKKTRSIRPLSPPPAGAPATEVGSPFHAVAFQVSAYFVDIGVGKDLAVN